MLVEEFTKAINEGGWYDKSVTPYFSKTDVYRNLGKNPLYVDNGNHSPSDSITQPSTIDYNGAKVDAEPIYLSDKKLAIYKIKNFGTDKVDSSLDFFGRGGEGEKKFRNTFDKIFGAARRNGKDVKFRTIASVTDSPERNSVRKTFWEFSMDGGRTWFVFRPNPTENMVQSKLVQKM